MIRFLKFSFLLFFILILSGCNEEPTSVGSNLLPEDGKIQFKQLDSKETPIAQSSSHYESKIYLGTSNYVILGKNSFVESSVLMQFAPQFTDSMVTYYKNNLFKIKKVWMEMKPVYKLGDESQNFSFSVHQIRSNWTSSGFDKDSLSSLQYENKDVATSKVLVDTLLTFNIESSVVEEWLKNKVDVNSAPYNRGFFLKPGPGCQRFLGFNAYGETAGSLLPTLKIEYEQNNSLVDTLFSTPYMDVHVVTGTVPAQSQYFYLQGGMTLWGFLSFDLSSLPKDIIINSAKLELTIDTLKTLNGNPPSDSINVRALKDSVTKKFTGDSLVVSVLKRTKNVYAGEITWLVQKWISSSDPAVNQGVALSLTDDERSVARIAVYGSKASDVANRPRIKIVYIQKK